MNFPILQACPVTASQFVLFWEQHYDFGNESTYYSILAKPKWETEDITNLFLWKNNMGNDKENLAGTKQIFVDKVISQMPRINQLRQNFNLSEYLDTFRNLSAIWGTTLLHAISNAQYPIYDQHVHRAFTVLSEGKPIKIPMHNSTKYRVYLEKYVPFFNNLKIEAQVKEPKKLDNALWAFGKFLSLYPRLIL